MTAEGRRVASGARRRLVVALVVAVGIVVASTAVLRASRDSSTPDARLAGGVWRSGASGSGVVDGSFGRWRGRAVDIAGTWNDGLDAQVNEWTVLPGAEYGSWQGDLDVAVGAIYKDQGESWSAAADGAYDARWREALGKLASAWRDKQGTLYIRFAHEFNGDWYQWSVSESEAADFRTAWARFRGLQQEIVPASKLVFCPSAETASSTGLDWRTAFPGSDEVDVLGVDFYNQYPYMADARTFEARLSAKDSEGAPRGLEAYRAYAESKGLPLAVPEWSSNADMGDGAAFMEAFQGWLGAHAGTGAGQVLYEIVFNVGSYGSGQFQLFPTTKQPGASDAYRELW